MRRIRDLLTWLRPARTVPVVRWQARSRWAARPGTFAVLVATMISSGSMLASAGTGDSSRRTRPITFRSPRPWPRANTRSIRCTFIRLVVPPAPSTEPPVTMRTSPSFTKPFACAASTASAITESVDAPRCDSKG